MPALAPGVPSSRWRLTEAAKEDCVLLAHRLPEKLAPFVCHSDQPKAAQTAAVIAMRRGLELRRDERLAEVDQGATGWLDDYEAVAERYLRTGEAPGWEPHDAVITRFEAAVVAATATSPEGDIVLVTHGLAPSLWLHSRSPRDDLAGFWRGLTLPDAWRLDLESGEATRVLERTA